MSQPQGIQSLTPIVNILIKDKLTPLGENEDLLSVTVSKDLDAIGMFNIKLNNWDLINSKFTWVDNDLFEIGNLIEIKIGYQKQHLKTLILGEITALEPEFAQESLPQLVVRGHDLGQRLLQSSKTRTFTKIKDSDIASQIAIESGLKAEVEDSKDVQEYVLQHNQTDMEFLKERAKQISYKVVLEKDTLYFRPRQNNSSEELKLKFGEDLIDFSPRLSTMSQVKEVKVSGQDPRTGKTFSSKANASNLTSIMGRSTTGIKPVKLFGKGTSTIDNQPISNQAEADEIALEKFTEIVGNYITGSGNCLGDPDLNVGKNIKITNIGERFSGLYYVTSITHTYSLEQGYRTSFTVKIEVR